MTINEIQNELNGYQSELEKIMETDDINALVERIAKTAGYHARTGYLLAEAKRLLRLKKSDEISNMVRTIAKEGHLSGKAQNALVDSIAIQENYVVDWADRINSMCVHQIDVIRTLISKEKAEMQMNNFIAKAE